MNKLLPFILLIAGVLLTTCEERERSNPIDPNADPDAWAPSNLQVQVIDDSQIKLTWTYGNEAISGFRLSRKEGNGSFLQIAELGSYERQYSDTIFSFGKDYTYRINAFIDINESGFAVSNVLYLSNYNSLVDIDGNEYETVIIGNQIWMAENLRVTHYRNGDEIYHLTDNNNWGTAVNGAYCSYNNDEGNVNVHGRLYNWLAVDDPRNIAPGGWHIPTDNEWKQLEIYLGMNADETNSTGWRGSDEGGKIKGLEHWNYPNTGATNESGFNALASGYRGDANASIFGAIGYFSIFWTTTSSDGSHSWARRLHNDHADIRRPVHYNRDGFSVRCIRD